MSTKAAIDEFQGKIRHLYEAEYGDFKRKVGLYLTRLEQDAGPALTRDQRIRLDQLKEEIIYSPATTNIESARAKILQVVESLVN